MIDCLPRLCRVMIVATVSSGPSYPSSLHRLLCFTSTSSFRETHALAEAACGCVRPCGGGSHGGGSWIQKGQHRIKGSGAARLGQQKSPRGLNKPGFGVQRHEASKCTDNQDAPRKLRHAALFCSPRSGEQGLCHVSQRSKRLQSKPWALSISPYSGTFIYRLYTIGPEPIRQTPQNRRNRV